MEHNGSKGTFFFLPKCSVRKKLVICSQRRRYVDLFKLCTAKCIERLFLFQNTQKFTETAMNYDFIDEWQCTPPPPPQKKKKKKATTKNKQTNKKYFKNFLTHMNLLIYEW